MLLFSFETGALLRMSGNGNRKEWLLTLPVNSCAALGHGVLARIAEYMDERMYVH